MTQFVMLVLAGVLGYFAYGRARVAWDGRRQWSRGLEAAPTGIAEIVAMADAAAGAIGPGTFRQVVALTGTVEGQTRKAPLSGADCVWYRIRTIRRYRTDKGSDTEIVGDQQVHGVFRLREGEAVVTVDPAGAHVDVPVADTREDGPDPDEGISLGPVRIGGRTLGFTRTEWRIDPGRRITVIGEAADTGAGVRVAAGPDQPLTLTGVDRSDHIETARRTSRAALLSTVGYGAGAVVALVLAFVL